MRKRNFGNGEVSLLGFGLMRLPCKDGPADIDRERALLPKRLNRLEETAKLYERLKEVKR